MCEGDYRTYRLLRNYEEETPTKRRSTQNDAAQPLIATRIAETLSRARRQQPQSARQRFRP